MVVCWGLALVASGGLAEGADRGAFAIETLVADLDAPWGVAIHPRTGDVYVSEATAGRVRRIDPDRPQLAGSVITGFDPIDPADDFPFGASLELAFLNHRTLLVADASCRGTWVALSAYDIPDAGLPIAADQVSQRPAFPHADAGEDVAATQRRWCRLTVVNDRVFLASAGRHVTGRIDRIIWRQGKPDTVPLWRTGARSETIGPTAIGINGRGYLVTTCLGNAAAGREGLLRFHTPANGRAVLDLPVDLSAIVDLAYHMREGVERLYVLNLAWNDAAAGGLYRIDAGRPGGERSAVRAVQILRVTRPTAMAFAADGRLFITTAGGPDASGAVRQGKLLVVTGDL